MTDWMALTRDGVERWLEAQREWWNAMARATGDHGPEQPPERVREDLQSQAVEAWRQAAYRIVDAQAEMLLGAVRQRPQADTETLVRQWTDAQREMWQGWLAVGGRGDAAAGGSPEDIAAAGRQMVDSLRQAAERLVESQAEWAKAWTAAQDDARRRAGEGERG